MKHLIFILIVIAFTACNNGGKPAKGTQGDNNVVNGNATPAGELGEGKRLIASFDCQTCHMPDTKVVGPSFMAISKRYPDGEGPAQNLARSIVSGSRGVWDTTVAMPAHPNISFNDALKMTRYILSLNSQAKRDSMNNINVK